MPGFLLELFGLLFLKDKLREVAMAKDTLDLMVVLILFLELLVIQQLFFFSWEQRTYRISGMRFPNSHVCILAARHNISTIHRVDD